MNLQGSQRGGAKDLALHLLKEENEYVDIHELRGFVSDDLVSALNEAYAISRGTKAKQFLFSLSLNPPPQENVSIADFENAIAKVEQKLGLTNQPRAIVFHEKQGRRHCHVVWSRIDAKEMKAIPLPYTRYKLKAISRELYLEHGWKMPRGYMNSVERDPKNFTLAQWQQARRIGKYQRNIMTVFQDCWAISDSQETFKQALKERGYTLARGDRRGFVALDHKCEIFAVSKWVGIRAKEVKSRLSDQDALPSVSEAKAQIAQDMAAHLTELQKQQNTAIKDRLSEIEQNRLRMVQQHRFQRQALKETQTARWQAENLQRQARINTGLRGLMDRVTGKYSRTKEQNEHEALLAYQRDRREKDTLTFSLLDQRRILQTRIERLQRFGQERSTHLSRDIVQYHDIEQQKRDFADFKPKMQNRTREGPGLEM